MLVEKMLHRARERLVVIDADAPVRQAAELMSKPQGSPCRGPDPVFAWVKRKALTRFAAWHTAADAPYLLK